MDVCEQNTCGCPQKTNDNDVGGGMPTCLGCDFENPTESDMIRWGSSVLFFVGCSVRSEWSGKIPVACRNWVLNCKMRLTHSYQQRRHLDGFLDFTDIWWLTKPG